MSVATSKFSGWLLQDGVWTAVCSGETAAVALRRLLDDHGGLGLTVVLPVGRRPDHHLRARQQETTGLNGARSA